MPSRAVNRGLRDIVDGIMAAATYCAATARHALLSTCPHFIWHRAAVPDGRCVQVGALRCSHRTGDRMWWKTPATRAGGRRGGGEFCGAIPGLADDPWR